MSCVMLLQFYRKWSLQHGALKCFILEPDKYVSDCLVAFLVDHAPHEVLNTIESVDVYAGNKKVATIILKNR